MFKKEFKERLRLLEYENEILADKLKSILEPNQGDELPRVLSSDMDCVRRDGMDYDTLRIKYRGFKPKFYDGL